MHHSRRNALIRGPRDTDYGSFPQIYVRIRLTAIILTIPNSRKWTQITGERSVHASIFDQFQYNWRHLVTYMMTYRRVVVTASNIWNLIYGATSIKILNKIFETSKKCFVTVWHQTFQRRKFVCFILSFLGPTTTRPMPLNDCIKFKIRPCLSETSPKKRFSQAIRVT